MLVCVGYRTFIFSFGGEVVLSGPTIIRSQIVVVLNMLMLLRLLFEWVLEHKRTLIRFVSERNRGLVAIW